jgi:hypothetical protein
MVGLLEFIAYGIRVSGMYGFYYEARVRFRVRVRYGGTPISKKLGYGYGGVFFYYIFLYIIIYIYFYIYF